MAATPQTSSRIPSVDGMRAIAIWLVWVGHITATLSRSHSGRTAAIFDVGTLGVRVFFVLSGFLITTLLLGELQKYDRISLPRFYYRRTLRIFPAFYAFLVILVLITVFGWVHIPLGNVTPALVYVSDYVFSGPVTLEHVCSLAHGHDDIRAVDLHPLDEWYQHTPNIENLQLDLSEQAACYHAIEGAAEVYNLSADATAKLQGRDPTAVHQAIVLAPPSTPSSLAVSASPA